MDYQKRKSRSAEIIKNYPYQTHQMSQMNKAHPEKNICDNLYQKWEEEYDIYLVEMYSFTKDINISFKEFKMIIYLCSK